MTDLKTETIKKKLRDMMYDTSVTIVILSPSMKESKWIDWKIEYSLCKHTRKGRISQTNGVVAVIQKVNGDYSWFKYHDINSHGSIIIYKTQDGNNKNAVKVYENTV